MEVIAFLKVYLPPVLCLITLAYLLAHKARREFFNPSATLRRELAEAIRKLKELRLASHGPVTDLSAIANDVMVGETLGHLWSEYLETLHPQKGINADGIERTVRYRSTALAETFFTEQALVDTPLKTDFFKHLPGILTGVGIIGTFLGLIGGLRSFHVSADAEVVRKSLTVLLSNVGEAFMVSCLAIICAMVFTFFEKAIVADCYKLVETLNQIIDSLFDAGAGEEYLARLVAASETSATQATQLKDALVSEFKQIMVEVSERQVTAAARNTSEMSLAIAQSFTDSISGPMEKISRAVDTVGSNQGDAVNRLLTDVLANFASHMEGLFGGQLSNINDLLAQTTETMVGVSSRFEAVASGVQSAGEGAANAMAEKLSQAITAMEARQEVMNAQMGEFVVQIKNLVQETQTETSVKMQGILCELGEKVSAMVTQLEGQSRESNQLHQSAQAHFADQMGEFVVQIKNIVQESQTETSQKMQGVLSELGEKVAGIVTQLEVQSRDSNQVHQTAQAQFAETANATVGGIGGEVQNLLSGIGGMVQEIKNIVQESQTETSHKMQGVLSELGEKVTGIVTQLEAQSRDSNQLHQAAQAHFAETAAATIGGIGGVVENLASGIGGMVQELTGEVRAASEVMRQSVASLSQSSRESIDKMNIGADILYMASTDFSKAGSSVTETVRESGRAVEVITGAAELLGSIVIDIRNILNDNERSKDTIRDMVNDLMKIVENARREASVSEELIGSIRMAAEQLSSAGKQAEEYLRGVTEVLGNAHEEFARNIERTLQRGNNSFQKELSEGVGILNIAIKDLGETIESSMVGRA